jgi:hypothetical protein
MYNFITFSRQNPSIHPAKPVESYAAVPARAVSKRGVTSSFVFVVGWLSVLCYSNDFESSRIIFETWLSSLLACPWKHSLLELEI